MQLCFDAGALACGRGFGGVHPFGFCAGGVELCRQRAFDLGAHAREFGRKRLLRLLRFDANAFRFGAGNLGFCANTLGFLGAQASFFGAQALGFFGAQAGFLGAQALGFFGLELHLVQRGGDGHFRFRPHARQLGVQLLARLPFGGLARFGDRGFAHALQPRGIRQSRPRASLRPRLARVRGRQRPLRALLVLR